MALVRLNFGYAVHEHVEAKIREVVGQNEAFTKPCDMNDENYCTNDEMVAEW
ncbi:hypothetical protein [Pedobacter chitinilyticus]|uniref:hypothetical protein n=1 Tax=Pedobacter chitinilyticus TaxID=2233776 RepID=UPI0013C46466|nr:hypothetical protein [Pedobacter chitinilyticus]